MSNEKYATMKIKEVMRRTSLAKSTIYLKMKQNVFPKRVFLTEGRVGWYEHEIQAWLENRPDNKISE